MGVSGFEELERALKRVDDAVSGQALAGAVTKGAEIVVEAAKSRAPRKTGKLAESIGYKIGKVSASGVRARIGVAARGGVRYAFHVEVGTKKRAPRPFLRPALRRSKDAVVDTIGTHLWAFIRRVLR